MATKKMTEDTVPLQAVVDVKIDVRQMIEEALDRRFHDSVIDSIQLDWDRWMDREPTLDDFWVAVKVELSPA